MRLIDGDALKEKLPNTYHNGFENCRECRLLEREEVNAYIDRMPTIDAAPVKHGRWVMMDGMKPPEWHHHHQCSVCESYAPMKPPYGGREEFPPFCPACGAKMDLEG
jgi:hypothetical protein